MPYLSPSTSRRLAVGLLLGAALTLGVHAGERNLWPVWVGAEDEQTGAVTAAQAIGPLLVERRGPDGAVQQMVRPLYWSQRTEKQETTHFLYPLLTWQREGDYSFFTLLQLVNDRRTVNGRGVPQHGFDVWPIYFSRETGDPATSYHAVFPIHGEIKERFGFDALRWTLFPLYLHTSAKGRESRSLPWPFIRVTEGAGHRGFEFWPLFGRRERAGDYREQFYLWPLAYQQERNLGDAVPEVKFGVLPFYTRDTGPGYRRENFLWPFFGYTDRTAPKPYHETRYLWPFFVQGRGEGQLINRWAPFYSHSVIKGYEKTWIFFPLGRTATWQDHGLAHERTQFLYFLYWSHEQRSLAHPQAAPAVKQHLWPFYSAWDNGAGRRQFQLFSPFEVFFPNNQPIRDLYSPLVAIYRYDERAPGDVRWSFLWSLVSRRTSPQEHEFHLGPLYSSRRAAAGERIALGAGLLSWRRAAGESRWKFSLFDFGSRPAKSGQPAAHP